MTLKKNNLYAAIIFIILVVLSGLAVAALAQETDEKVVNWCYEGQPWAGQCDHPDPDVQHFLWKAGWCQAALEAGVVEGDMDSCMSIPDVEEEDESSDSKSESKSEDKPKKPAPPPPPPPGDDDEDPCVGTLSRCI
jgi:hypothetical protein